MLRLKILGVLLLVLFSGLIVRLFYWQVLRGRELSVFALSQHRAGESLEASRGEIFASDGSWLVAAGQAWSVNASIPKLTIAKASIAKKLAPIFVQDKENVQKVKSEEARLLGLLEREGLIWAVLKNKVTPKQKEEIERLDIAGLVFEEDERREYPEASAAAHVLGFVGKDSEGRDTGYFGLEGYYDVILSGKPGYLSQERNALGAPIALEEAIGVKAIGGTSIVTNIDKGIQIAIEKKLTDGLKNYGAASGTVIVMNPKSGQVLGMASFPTYDPALYGDFDNALFLNPAISLSFEPGSIFKVIVMASALDAQVVTPETKCDICDKAVRIDNYSIETWDGKFRPEASMTDVIVNSDNVGMVFVAQKLGLDKLYDYLTSFGIGEKTGIDLQGEASPALRKKDNWRTIDVATASFGQGIATTPMQMVRAVSVIANGGKLVNPKVAGKFKGDDWQEDINLGKTREVISSKAAKEITAMMVEAASKGEAKWTYLKGYKVAGKTGTAQIPIAGHYDSEKTVASFVGFAPWDDPKFIMLVTLREPQSSPWASETAAPLWYSIAQELFLHFGIQPN